MKIGIGLMASGSGSRMGKNKLLVEFQGKSLAQHMMDKLEKLRDEARGYELEFVVVSKYQEVLILGKDKGFKVLDNERAQLGQSESIKLITKALGHCQGILFLPCDQVFIKVSSLDGLIRCFVEGGGSEAVQASCKGKPSSPVIFPPSYYEALLNLEGDKGGRSLLKGKTPSKLEVTSLEQVDLDTMEDLETYMRENIE